jgi:hypothetical protein
MRVYWQESILPPDQLAGAASVPYASHLNITAAITRTPAMVRM